MASTMFGETPKELAALSAYAGTVWRDFDPPEENVKRIVDALRAKAMADLRAPLEQSQKAIRAALIDFTPKARLDLIAAYDLLAEELREP